MKISLLFCLVILVVSCSAPNEITGNIVEDSAPDVIDKGMSDLGENQGEIKKDDTQNKDQSSIQVTRKVEVYEE